MKEKLETLLYDVETLYRQVEDMEIENKEKRGSRMKFSKVIVTLIVLLNTAFTAAVLYIFFTTHNEPTVLIGAWFAFTTGELWLTATIKKKEIEKDEY